VIPTPRDALRRVLGDARLRAGLVAAGLERADEFSMVRLAERFTGIYERAIAANHARHEAERTAERR
jgi:hypothetical protein